MATESAILPSENSTNQVNQTTSTMPDIDLSRIRSWFPILSRTINGYPLAFLDNASTTQKPDSVLQAMLDFYRHSNSNVSRGVYTLADESTGLYEMARKGIIKEFTGISDPYEIPTNAEIMVNSSGTPPEELIDQIYLRIKEMGYIKD